MARGKGRTIFWTIVCTIVLIGAAAVGINTYRQSTCEHEYGEGKVVKEATCTEDGEIEYECDKCWKVKTENIPATGHTALQLDAIPATCTSTGLHAGEVCEVCEKVLIEQEVIPVLGHNLETVAGQEATCTESGYYTYEVCADCGYTENYVEIPATGHNLETVAGQAATCTELGWNEYQVCQKCGYTENYVEIPATGHNVVDGVCTYCNGSYEETAVTTGELVAGKMYRIYINSGDVSSLQLSLFGAEGMRFYINSSTRNYGYLWVGSMESGPLYCFEGMRYNVTDEYVDFYFEEGTYNIVRYDGTATDLTYTIDETTTITSFSDGYVYSLGYHEHQMETVAGQAATCTELGWNEYQVCQKCGYTDYVEIPATGHSDEDADNVCDDCGFDMTTASMTEAAVTKGELVAGNWYRLYRNDVSTMSNLYLSGDNNNGNLCVNNYSEYYNSTYFCSGPCYYLEGMETVITDEYTDMYLAVGTYNVLSTSSGSSTGKTVTIDKTTTITSFTDGYVYRLDCFEHQLETVAEKAATCTELGWNEHQGCQNCGYTENYVEIPATGHSDEDADNVCDDCGFDMTKLLEVATVDGELVAGNWYRVYLDSENNLLRTFKLSGFDDEDMYFYIYSSTTSTNYLWVGSMESGPLYCFEGMQVNVTDEYIDFYFEEGTYNIVKNDGTATDLTYTIDETTTLATAYSWLYRLESQSI